VGNLLTIPEVAERLRVSERTIRKRIGAGFLPALKLGPEMHAPVRVTEEALAGFLRSTTNERSK
jgi:excisionase family DNA binding protein